MSKHLYRDFEQLQRDVLSLSAIVEDMIDKAALALRDRRIDLVDDLVDTDKIVDQQEVNIEEECLKMMALHQPVAVDLRRISTVLKINNDLERIGDLAVHVAERARDIHDYPEFTPPQKLDQMITQATLMVRGALDSFVSLDTDQARRVLAMDDDVDQLNLGIIHDLQQAMQHNSQIVIPALHCFSACRHIERIGDLATNIAEDVIYLVEGEIIRHKSVAWLLK